MKIHESTRDITVSLKDNDFRAHVLQLNIIEQIIPRGANKGILDIIDIDADFLASCNIIDYSLLLGEIFLKSDDQDGIEDLRNRC